MSNPCPFRSYYLPMSLSVHTYQKPMRNWFQNMRSSCLREDKGFHSPLHETNWTTRCVVDNSHRDYSYVYAYFIFTNNLCVACWQILLIVLIERMHDTPSYYKWCFKIFYRTLFNRNPRAFYTSLPTWLFNNITRFYIKLSMSLPEKSLG